MTKTKNLERQLRSVRGKLAASTAKVNRLNMQIEILSAANIAKNRLDESSKSLDQELISELSNKLDKMQKEIAIRDEMITRLKNMISSLEMNLEETEKSFSKALDIVYKHHKIN